MTLPNEQKRILVLKRYFEYPVKPVASAPATEYHSASTQCSGAVSSSDNPLPD